MPVLYRLMGVPWFVMAFCGHVTFMTSYNLCDVTSWSHDPYNVTVAMVTTRRRWLKRKQEETEEEIHAGFPELRSIHANWWCHHLWGDFPTGRDSLSWGCYTQTDDVINCGGIFPTGRDSPSWGPLHVNWWCHQLWGDFPTGRDSPLLDNHHAQVWLGCFVVSKPWGPAWTPCLMNMD